MLRNAVSIRMCTSCTAYSRDLSRSRRVRFFRDRRRAIIARDEEYAFYHPHAFVGSEEIYEEVPRIFRFEHR